MTAREIIEKKRDDGVLTNDEISFFVRGFVEGQVTDYQAAALLMAICIRGMTVDETVILTREMRDSGKVLDLSSIPGPKIDKHSTGGVGDKTSILIAPIVAACGVKMPMICGRALGHTGGTLDKLQSIRGFDPQPTPHRILTLLKQNGAVLMGQTRELAPADARMYALRDATGTVESIPLITASILSKKLSEGIDGLVLDVKTGSGALMPSHRMSVKLAQSIIRVSERLGVKTVAVLTSMDQPLGRAVGNAMEVRECLEFFDGNEPADLATVTFELSAQMILLAGLARTSKDAFAMARDAVASGAAKRRFMEIVAVQGGDVRVLRNPDSLPRAQHVSAVKSPRDGVVVLADARQIGIACNSLGAGRARMDDRIDPAVGAYLHKKVGDTVRRGETLCEVHWNGSRRPHDTMASLGAAFNIGNGPIRKWPMIRRILKGWRQPRDLHEV